MSFLIEATVKLSRLQAFIRPSSGFGSIQVRFQKSDQTHVFHPICVGIPRIIAAVLVVTIVQHRTSVLDQTARMCSKTSRVDNTKSVGNRSKLAEFVRTAQGLSLNQNEVAINSKSDLWRTALLVRLILHPVECCEHFQMNEGTRCQTVSSLILNFCYSTIFLHHSLL